MLEVEECRLFYKQQRESKVVRGEIPLREGMVGLLPALNLHPEWTPFYVYAGAESFAMAAESLEDAQFWVSALVEAVREAGAREGGGKDASCGPPSPRRPGSGQALVPDGLRRELDYASAGGGDSASDLSDASPSPSAPRGRARAPESRPQEDARGAELYRASSVAPADSSLATTSASEAEDSASAESPTRLQWGSRTGQGKGAGLAGGTATDLPPERPSSGRSPRRGRRRTQGSHEMGGFEGPAPLSSGGGAPGRRGAPSPGISPSRSATSSLAGGGSGSEAGRRSQHRERQASNAAQIFSQFIHSPALPGGGGEQRSTKDEVLEVMGSVLEDVVKVKHEQLEKVSAALDYAQLELGVSRGRIGQLEGNLQRKDEALASVQSQLQRTLEELADHGKRLADTATKLAETTLELDTERQQTKTLKGVVVQLQEELGEHKRALRGAQGALGSAERAIRQQALEMNSIEDAVTRPFWSPGSPSRPKR